MIDLLRWYLAIEIIGLVAWPLCWRLCANLADRGYGLSKALGLLLVCYTLWVSSSFGFLGNDLGGILASLLTVAGLSLWALRRSGQDGRPFRTWTRENSRLIFFSEGLFLVAYIAWAIFRAYDPAIAGTEKPMEFAFLNGILRSDRFPPLDPWLSGYAISYYYFGYVMLAVLTRLSGVPSAVGFNLGLASWFALTVLGAFSVTYSLMNAGRGAVERRLLPALLGPLFVAFLGNLEGLFEVLHSRGIGSPAFYHWLDVKNLDTAPVTSRWLPMDTWWWWRASRVIQDRDLLGRSIGIQPIDEFPFFSFLLGDMHPHVLALPFVLLAIGLGLNLALHGRQPTADNGQHYVLRNTHYALRITYCVLRNLVFDAWPMAWTGVLLYALALGALGFLNTWDFPIYLFLVAMAFGLRRAMESGLRRADEDVPPLALRLSSIIGDVLRVGVILGVLGFLLYLPFYLGFSSQAGGILPNLIFPTRLHQFVLMFGVFLVMLLGFLLTLTARLGWEEVLRRSLEWVPLTLGTPIAIAALAALLLQVTPGGRSFLQSVFARPEVREQIGDLSTGQLLMTIAMVRLRTPGTTLLLAVGLAWVLGLLRVRLDRPREHAADPITGYVLVMVGTALLLTFAVEWVYLKDTFGVRMNTVFKFYYQAWVLMALSSAYAVARIWRAEDGGRKTEDEERRTESEEGLSPSVYRLSSVVFILLSVVLVAAGLVYTIAGAYSKANGFRGEATLDGIVHLRRYQPDDAAAIDWLQVNIKGAPVLLEAPGGSYSPYNRISMATGLPTLLGWDGHELQWRGDRYGELTAGRPEAIERIYRTARGQELIDLMRAWDVEYLYVGSLEREKYHLTQASISRFEQTLWKVYENETVRIYRRPGPLEEDR
ncbi:MAG TPA: hypothetical protein G4O02_01580 [Caldilineae bacterium]|nr:hypothetical protein [Caldilineae bacterium]